MNDVRQQRRNAHYGKTENSPEEKSEFIRIFIQLIICMAILAGVLYGNGYRLSHGETIGDFVRHTLSHTTNVLVPVSHLRNFVSEKFGPINIPDPGESAVFNETTPTKSTE